MRFILLILQLYLVSMCQGARRYTPTTGLSAAEYNEIAVERHNAYRANHQAGPLTTDNYLCSIAQGYANKQAAEDPVDENGNIDMNRWDHNPNLPGSIGENLYFSKGDCYPEHAVEMWYDEIRDYNDVVNGQWVRYNKLPIMGSKNGNQVGHFTQLVWKSTKRMCMAYAKSKKGRCYVVANYFPAGNIPYKDWEYVLPPLENMLPTTPKAPKWQEVCTQIQRGLVGDYAKNCPVIMKFLSEQLEGNICDYCVPYV